MSGYEYEDTAWRYIRIQVSTDPGSIYFIRIQISTHRDTYDSWYPRRHCRYTAISYRYLRILVSTNLRIYAYMYLRTCLICASRYRRIQMSRRTDFYAYMCLRLHWLKHPYIYASRLLPYQLSTHSYIYLRKFPHIRPKFVDTCLRL